MNRIREVRERMGLNQRHLAERTHTPQSIISDVELGKREAWPSLRRRIAGVLKMPVSELFPSDFPAQGGSDGK